MIKLIQIIGYLRKQGLSDNEIHAEVVEIVDNGRSEYFELSDRDIIRITDVFHNEKKYEAAFALIKI